MTVSHTHTISSTFTRTHARYLASKLAADLRQMQLFYGEPSDREIAGYVEEAIILLLGGYLGSVTYGFKRGTDWVVALRYDVHAGTLLPDERSGRVPSGVSINGAHWYSYLTYSTAFHQLPQAARERIKAQLPIQRSAADEPGVNGAWAGDKSYAKGGVSLRRNTFEAL